MNKKLSYIIGASSVGTLIEWYDFYIFGSLATVLSTKFFPTDNPTAAFLNTLATFAAGFVVRPFGALFFGKIGDVIGRKYTFMVTLMLMGGATFAIGLVPSYQNIGALAPILVLLLRLLQGLALGGEYGGAATYVAEHSPENQRGFYTSWIQTTATLGLIISLGVIMVTRGLLSPEEFDAYGWRIPFLISIIMVIGSITALFMGFLGIIQNDIKRAVAYSTLSQLGYMTVALGASAYSVAVFHLMTHAFFKALLFLGAGSVIMACTTTRTSAGWVACASTCPSPGSRPCWVRWR